MNNVVMKNCDLTGCDFQDAELAGADLRFCTVTGCNFKGTELDFPTGYHHIVTVRMFMERQL